MKRLQGNPGRRKLNTREPAPAVEAGPPEPPEWADLSDVGKECWRRLVGVLYPMKLATVADYELLAQACDVFARWRVAKEFLQKHGDTYPIKDEAGNVKCVAQFPQVSMFRNLGADYHRRLTEFGLTPASRSRLALPGEEVKEDPMEAFLKIAG